MLGRLLMLVTFAACVHADDPMIENAGYPGFNVFAYTHCGVAVRGNGSHALPWTGAPRERVQREGVALVAQLGTPGTLRETELGRACYGHDASVLHLVLSDWSELDRVLRGLGHWLVAASYGGEIDVVVRSGESPPRGASAAEPMPPPGPCVATSSRAGFTIYDCPRCGTAIVGAGTTEFAWRTNPDRLASSHGVSALRANGVGEGCFSHRLTPVVTTADETRVPALAEQLGAQLAEESSGEEIDVHVMPGLENL